MAVIPETRRFGGKVYTLRFGTYMSRPGADEQAESERRQGRLARVVEYPGDPTSTRMGSKYPTFAVYVRKPLPE